MDQLKSKCCKLEVLIFNIQNEKINLTERNKELSKLIINTLHLAKTFDSKMNSYDLERNEILSQLIVENKYLRSSLSKVPSNENNNFQDDKKNLLCFKKNIKTENLKLDQTICFKNENSTNEIKPREKEVIELPSKDEDYQKLNLRKLSQYKIKPNLYLFKCNNSQQFINILIMSNLKYYKF